MKYALRKFLFLLFIVIGSMSFAKSSNVLDSNHLAIVNAWHALKEARCIREHEKLITPEFDKLNEISKARHRIKKCTRYRRVDFAGNVIPEEVSMDEPGAYKIHNAGRQMEIFDAELCKVATSKIDKAKFVCR